MLPMRRISIATLLLLVSPFATNSRQAIAEDTPPASSIKVAKERYESPLKIPKPDLEVMLKPLTSDELVVEADIWLGLLKAKVSQISEQELIVKSANREIKKAEGKGDRKAG